MANQAPFVIQPYLTSIALTYRNQKLIADQVLPRIPVLSTNFKWSAYTKEDSFTIPNTLVGRKGDVTEIDWSATEQTSSVNDYGLEEAIPQSDIDNAKSVPNTPIDPQARATEQLTDILALSREKRVADLLFTAANYPSGNKVTLSGTGQWSDYTNSDPVTAILTAFDGMLVRPNIGIVGRAVYTKLRMHPKVVAAVFAQGGNAASGGITSLQAIADLLELDQLYVGESFLNTAKKGQTGSYSQVWGKNAAFLYQNPAVQSPTGAVTFGFTAEWGTRLAGVIERDPDIGLRGGNRVRVGESVKELIAASDTGYLFTAAVA